MSKEVEAALAKPHPKVPDEDETLHPSGSIIHWAEIYKTLIPSRSKMNPRWYVPVTCGRGGLHCLGKRPVQVRRGLTRPEGLSADCLTLDECFTGVCRGCGRSPDPHPPVEKLPNGAEIFWGKLTEGGLPYRCATCRRMRLLSSARPSLKDFSGVCHSCAVRKKVGEEDHPSGAKILWDTRTTVARTPAGGGDYKVEYICVGCKLRRGPIRSSVVCRQEWRGRCTDCLAAEGSPHRIREEMVLPSGSIALKWKRHPDDHTKIAVRCGLFEGPDRKCDQENFFSKSSVDHPTQTTGFCSRHTRDEIYSHFAISRNGNGQRNGGEEKKLVGRPRNDVTQTLTDIKREVLRLKAEGKKHSSVTSNRVASILNIGGVTGGNAMMERLRKGGIHISWPDLKDMIWDEGRVPETPLNSEE